MLREISSFTVAAICFVLATLAWRRDAIGYAGAAAPAWIGLSAAILGAGYLLGRPGIFLKRPTGSLHPAGWFLHWPLHVVSLLMHLKRRVDRVAVCSPIHRGLIVGRWLTPSEAHVLDELRVSAVLDMTAELPETGLLLRRAYLCLPVLDGRAPTMGQIEEGCRFMAHHLVHDGVVYLHCAAGRGRSATMAAAYLVRAGIASGVDSAVGQVRRNRPGTHITPRQRRALDQFAGCLQKGSIGS